MNAEQPRFSIIMPTYRSTATVGRAIRSVLAQSMPDWELIVVDDGSGDDTAEEARQAIAGDARAKVIESEHAGVSATRNVGIALARGEYVTLLDADDELQPEYIRHMSQIFDADPELTFASCNAWCIDPDGTRHLWHEEREMLRPSSFSMAELLRDNKVYISATIRTDALQQAGCFRDRFQACEDYGVWLEVLARGGRHHYTPEPLATYYRTASSISANRERENEVLTRLMTDMAADARLTAEERRIAEKRREQTVARMDLYRRVRMSDMSGGRPEARMLARAYTGPLKALFSRVASVLAPGWFIRLVVRRTSAQLTGFYENV